MYVGKRSFEYHRQLKKKKREVVVEGGMCEWDTPPNGISTEKLKTQNTDPYKKSHRNRYCTNVSCSGIEELFIVEVGSGGE